MKPLLESWAKRERIRSSFTEWCRFRGFEPARHHQLIIKELEAVARGDNSKLALFLPPGSAKSTYGSILFPPWYMQAASGNVLAASHTTELAEKWGRKVRNSVNEHSVELGIRLAEDSQAAGRWALDSGLEYYSAGVGTGIAGFRAKFGIIDDPIRSRQDADSELIRDRIWDWYINDFRTRLVPGAAEILIQTRWHEDDLGGWLLEEEKRGGDKWEVLSLPAVAETHDPLGREVGEPLWPEWQDGTALQRVRDAVGPRTWSALFQQRPQPDEGTYFQRGWFKRYAPAAKPANLHVYGSSDYAVTEDGGDYTVHRVWGVDPGGGLWLLAGWRGQTTADVWIERAIDLIIAHKPLAWFGEGGVIAKAIEPMLRRRMTERKTACRLEWLPSINDKPTRARGFQARSAMGQVHLPEGTDGDLVLDEYLHFPAGKHDDEVDCGSLIGRALDEMHPAIVTTKVNDPNPTDRKQWKVVGQSGGAGDSWKTA